MRESAKKVLKKPLNGNLPSTIKNMTIICNYIHFNTIIYTKQCCVQSFDQKKPNLKLYAQKC